MTTPCIRALSQRAGARPALLRTFTHGRSAAYRRIPSDLRQYGHATLRQQRHGAAAIALLQPRPRQHLPPASPSVTSIRHISFKEMREERARQRAGESQPPSQKDAQAARRQQQEPDPTPEVAQASKEQSATEDAEEAFARIKAESEARSAKEEAQYTEQKEGQQSGEQAEGEGEQEKDGKAEAPPPPHGNKTPWQVFTETLQAEFKASKDWEESTKQLSGSINDFTQNPNVQRARSAYSRAAETASTVTGKAFLGTAGAIGRSAAWTWQTPVARGIRQGAAAVGSGVEKATRPVRETEAYKSVKETIDDGASQRYGGWTEKEERRRRREERERRAGLRPHKPEEKFDEDPTAGTNVTLHKDAAWKESWRDFRDNNPVMQRLFGFGTTYRESENPLISTARSVSDRIAGFFAENETARVIKAFREMDPSFQLEPFLTEMRGYILPEVLEAYVTGDVETLKLWLSAAQFQVYSALMQQYTQNGLYSDGRILDIRNVDVLSARMLEPGDIPVFVVMCRTQEVHVYRHKETGALAAGMEDKVQQVTYAIGVTRLPEEVANPETRGWRLIELQKSGRDYI